MTELIITDKASDTLKMPQEIRSSCAALFCKNDVLKNFIIFIKTICDGVPFGKTVSPHVCNCTKNDAITGVFLLIDFVNTIFLVHFTQASVGTCCTN